MLLLKACPHCQGDLVLEQDYTCGYLTCVQCGHILSAEQERALGYHVTNLGLLHVCAGPRPASTHRAHTRDAVTRKHLHSAAASAG
jgi:hypothetical protein